MLPGKNRVSAGAVRALTPLAFGVYLVHNLLVDAVSIDLAIPQRGLIQGDARCHAIAAASMRFRRDMRQSASLTCGSTAR